MSHKNSHLHYVDETKLEGDADLAENELWHVGVIRKSGRYPYGSGENPAQRNRTFMADVKFFEDQGMNQTEVAEAMGLTRNQLQANKAIAKNAIKKDQIATALALKEKQMSNTAAAEQMGIPESTFRGLISADTRAKSDRIQLQTQVLRDNVGPEKYLDIGLGTEHQMKISSSALTTAVENLRNEGYVTHRVEIPQQGNPGKFTSVKVLAPPGTTYGDIIKNQDRIKTMSSYSEDHGQTFRTIKPPVSVDPKRVGVRYKEQGGDTKDGVIELRRGVDDISLGNSNYAQVRIKVGKDKYLKGMAMYSDDLPDGVDLLFNTNKSDTGNKLDAMKDIKKTKDGREDPDMPFGSIVRQKTYLDKSGKEKQSLLNIVGTPKPDSEEVTSGEEGGWSTWSKNLSSQMLSKQTPALAKQQLGLSGDIKRADLDEIMALENPMVKRKLLEAFADGADSSAVHLKAAGLPRTANHVILPINSLKDTEIYAPKYRDGERVVLIRHPHGGIFEIPELTVNNRNKEANSVMKNAKDAVGINSRVAERLSGADFDGDTVLVIPNAPKGSVNRVNTKPPLEGLKDFDPKKYKRPSDVPKLNEVDKDGNVAFPFNKQNKMGDISNLITDMTIKGAPDDEIARAVRHSMVVIDADKHNLDYKRSEADNGIKQLKKEYQGRSNGGSATLISRAKGDQAGVDKRKARPSAEGGPIDPATGKKMYVRDEKAKYTNAKGEEVYRREKISRMEFTDDANTLSSGTTMEKVYADHANRLKAMGNEARKAAYETKPTPRDKEAALRYKPEVDSLKAKLIEAQTNSPRERQAQIVAGRIVAQKRQENPAMEKDEEKKVKALALAEARARTGAKKKLVDITEDEWKAVQEGAVSPNLLANVLNNADLDKVKQLATPRQATVMVPAKVKQAQLMLSRGFTQAEVADRLGVPVSTLTSSLTTE